MKKINLLLCILLCLMLLFNSESVKAQVFKFRAVEFAIKEKSPITGTWTAWTDWQRCNNVVVTMDCTKNIVSFNTKELQIYYIIDTVDKWVDESGGTQTKMSFLDQDMDKGFMRLRTDVNGHQQVYIEYANIMWVYNVKMINY